MKKLLAILLGLTTALLTTAYFIKKSKNINAPKLTDEHF